MAIFIGAMLSAPASAADDSDPFSSLQKVIEAWNKGDMTTVSKAMAPTLSVIDEFPPYQWSGPTGFKDYMRDYAALVKASGITDPVFTMSQRPISEEMHGNAAYIVVSGVNSYKQDGKRIAEAGIMTVALRKSGSNWLLTACAWAKQ